MSICSYLGGGLSIKIFDWIISRKRANTEIDITISEAWEKYAEKMERRLCEMEHKYDLLRAEYLELQLKYMELERTIK